MKVLSLLKRFHWNNDHAHKMSSTRSKVITRIINKCILNSIWKWKVDTYVSCLHGLYKLSWIRKERKPITGAWTNHIYKITKIVRTLWLAERSVCMRVCKHGCGVKLFGFSCANHASTNLKKFSSSKLDKFTLFTHSSVGWNLENRYKEGGPLDNRHNTDVNAGKPSIV